MVLGYSRVPFLSNSVAKNGDRFFALVYGKRENPYKPQQYDYTKKKIKSPKSQDVALPGCEAIAFNNHP